jgi:hypothetical protein
MKKDAEAEVDPLDQEWDFSKAIPNPFAGKRIRNLVVLAPDVLKAFPDSTAVNDALRELVVLRERAKRVPKAKRASFEVRAKKTRS